MIDRWDAGSRLIESYDLFIEFQQESYCVKEGQVVRLIRAGETSTAEHSYSHILRSGDRRLGEFTTVKDDFRNLKFWFDGITFTTASLPQNEYVLQPDCIMFGSKQGEDYEVLYRTVLGATDRIALSRKRNARLLQREGNLYVVDVPAAANPGPWWQLAWKVWLDPSCNFLPVRWSHSISKLGRTIHDSDQGDCTVNYALNSNLRR